MVKLMIVMEAIPQEEPQPRPGLIHCIRLGFDTVANHVWVILIPVMIDLMIWFGPHLRMKGILDDAALAMQAILNEQGSMAPDILQANRELWQVIAERFNFLSLLRTMPVGVPSLMSGRYPLQTPLGTPVYIELSALPSMVLTTVTAIGFGLIVGAFYYLLIAHLVSQGTINWLKFVRAWPQALLRSVILSILLVGILILLTIPFSCFLGLLAASGVGVNNFGSLLYGIVLAWWMFPLIFSAHGIFLYNDRVGRSVQRSVRFIRQTFPLTGLLFIIIVVFAEGLDLLWNTPLDTSWLLLLGIAGHAFVTTAMLATSFIYYGEMNNWLQSRLVGQAVTPRVGRV